MRHPKDDPTCPRFSRILLFFLFASLLTSPLLQACSSGNDDNGESGGRGGFGGFGDRGTTVEVAEISRDSIFEQVRSYGSVRSRDRVIIMPQVNEQVTRIHVEIGDTVQQGDLLAQLYDETFRDELRSAQAQHEQNRVAFEQDSTQYYRTQRLYEREAVSEAEYQEARSAYRSSRAAMESSEASLTQTRQNLNNTRVRAPVDGVVTQRHISQGDMASSGQEMFEIANLEGYEVRLNIPRRDWRRVEFGQAVDLRISGDEDFVAEGTVTRKSPNLDENTGLGMIIISITDTGGEIFPGVLTEARINVDESRSTIVIPRTAMVESVETIIDPESNSIELERRYSAFVVQGDTVAHRRNLELGIEQGERVEVVSGLQEGEKLVITGQDRLDDQERVRLTSRSREETAGSSPQTDTANGELPQRRDRDSRPDTVDQEESQANTTGLNPDDTSERQE